MSTSSSHDFAAAELDSLLSAQTTRRVRLLRTLIPALFSIVILTLCLLAGLLFFNRLELGPSFMGLFSLLVLLAISLLVALLAVRTRRIRTASGVVLGVVTSGAVGIQILWSGSQGITPYSLIEFSTFGVVLVLTGLLGNALALWILTIVLAGVTGAILWFIPPNPLFASAWASERFLVLPNLLLALVLFAGVVFAITRNNDSIVRDLRQAYDRSRQLELLKDQFITSVNHELRSPLMALQLLLQTAVQTPVPPQQMTEIIVEANQASNHLVSLVQSILSLQHIDREVDEIHATRLALLPIIEQARLLDYDSHARQVIVDVPPTLQVFADPLRLGQVFINLLSNAAKYSPEDTPITITARANDRTVLVTIQDQGLGIPPDQHDVLFHRFVRLPRDLASTIRGNGLGLYLCRRFIEAMHGQIWIESSGIPYDGTRFLFTLPTHAASLVDSPGRRSGPVGPPIRPVGL